MALPHTPSRLLALVGTAVLTGTAHAALVVHEPFDYADTGGVTDGAFLGDGNQGGALGTTGTWSQVDNAGNGTPGGTPTNEIDVRAGGLSFSDSGGNVLPTSGNFITRDNRVGQTAAWISLAAPSTAALTADNSTIWMTFLFQDRGFSGPDSGIALASERMVAADSQALSAAGFGVGVGVNSTGGQNRNVGTIVYDNTTGQAFNPEATPTFNGPGASGVHLLAMKVNWNPLGTPDEVFVFDITDITTEPAESSALASDTFDWSQAEQNSLTLLTIGETQVDSWDEIRIATSFAEAIPEPSVGLLGALSGLLVLRRRRR